MERNIISTEELFIFEKKIREQVSRLKSKSLKNPLLVLNTGGVASHIKLKVFIDKFLNILSEFQSYDTKYHFILTREKIEVLNTISFSTSISLKNYLGSLDLYCEEHSLVNTIHYINTLDFEPEVIFIFNTSRNKDFINDSNELRDGYLNISRKCVWILPEDYMEEFVNLDTLLPVEKNYVEVNINSNEDKIDIFQKALTVATKAHKNQFRKGTITPYIVHPIMVGMLLREENCLEHLVLAGVLHDTIEDSHVTYEDIKSKFGEKIAIIVWNLSDKDQNMSWESRKRNEINFLKEKASTEEILIACADKYHNISCISSDYRMVGDSLWERFNAPKVKQRWYYQELVNIFDNRDDIPENFTLLKKFNDKVHLVFPD